MNLGDGLLLHKHTFIKDYGAGEVLFTKDEKKKREHNQTELIKDLSTFLSYMFILLSKKTSEKATPSSYLDFNIHFMKVKMYRLANHYLTHLWVAL